MQVIGHYLRKYPKLSWLIHIPACILVIALVNGWLL